MCRKVFDGQYCIINLRQGAMPSYLSNLMGASIHVSLSIRNWRFRHIWTFTSGIPKRYNNTKNGYRLLDSAHSGTHDMARDPTKYDLEEMQNHAAQ
jgi:hypothetical protein